MSYTSRKRGSAFWDGPFAINSDQDLQFIWGILKRGRDVRILPSDGRVPWLAEAE